MRARRFAHRLVFGALSAGALSALAACGGEPEAADAPAAQVEFAEEAPLPEIPAAAPAPAPAVDAAATPDQPIPYEEANKGPAQKADAENENVFY